MKGKVLDFNISTNEGIITGEDGTRYNFVSTEWKSSSINPAQGVEVDFVVEDDNATAIYAEESIVNTPLQTGEILNIWQYYVAALKNYATFTGRVGQAGFWYYQLVNFGISFVLGLISAGTLSLIYALGVLVPGLAIGARRLHDTGRSGWWQLLMLIPLIGLIVLIIFWAQASDQEKNQYNLD